MDKFSELGYRKIQILYQGYENNLENLREELIDTLKNCILVDQRQTRCSLDDFVTYLLTIEKKFPGLQYMQQREKFIQQRQEREAIKEDIQKYIADITRRYPAMSSAFTKLTGQTVDEDSFAYLHRAATIQETGLLDDMLLLDQTSKQKQQYKIFRQYYPRHQKAYEDLLGEEFSEESFPSFQELNIAKKVDLYNILINSPGKN